MEETVKKPRPYITIGGRSLPMRVTMGAMLRFKRTTGHDVKEMRSDDIEEVITFLWCCVVSACHADGVDDIPDLETFADLLGPDDLQAFYALIGVDAQVEKKTPTAMTPTAE